MLRETRIRRRFAFTFCVLTLIGSATAWLGRDRSAAHAAPGLVIGITARDPESPRRAIPVTLDRVHRKGRGYVADLDGGARAELTLEPRLQAAAEQLLARHHAPYGAAVVVSVEDGRVLALAGRSFAEPARSPASLALTPWAPAASVFKLVTAAALVDRGVSPEARVCYHDGVHSVEADNLVDRPRFDDQCGTLAFGIARSQNAILARLAHDHLDRAALDRAAHALGFGEALPFDVAVAPSSVSVPAGGLPFARVAAGFWQTTLSPLHGAWLAATIARGGTTPPLHVVERVLRGAEVLRPMPPAPRRVLDEKTARAVGAMMTGTTRYGTARLGFNDRGGRPYLPVTVAGKTGSLNRPPSEGGFLAYSWFVGYAPAERPEVAVAVLVGNGSARDAKAAYLARDLLGAYFDGTPSALVAAR